MIRLLATGIGVMAALIMTGVSAGMNIAFLSSLGRTETESLILAAASGAADGLKALIPVFAVWAWQNGRRVFVLPAVCVWALFVGFSLLSAFGFAASIRVDGAEKQDQLNAALISLRGEISAAQKALQDLPKHRPAQTVQSEIAASRQHQRWGSTKGCTDATLPESRAFCAEYFKLQGELAAAQKADEIQVKLNALKTRENRLLSKGAGQSSDPQSALLSGIVGLSDDRIRLALIIILAVVVELGSSLGLFLATGHGPLRQDQKPTAANDNEPEPFLIDARPVCMVEDWALARLVPMPNAELNFNDAYADYQALCRNADLEELEQAEFTNHLIAIADKIGLDRRETSIHGVAISEPIALTETV